MPAKEPTARERFLRAVETQNHTLIRKLLDPSIGGVNPNVCTSPWKNTGLHLAAMHNDIESLQIILKAGGELNRINSEGSTPLLVACHVGHEKTIEFLINAGAEINPNHQGKHPLHLAASNGLPNSTAMLLRMGSDPNAVDNNGNTPLHLATSHANINIGAFYKTISLLLDAGANAEIPNKAGIKPIEYKDAIITIRRHTIKKIIRGKEEESLSL